jgi:hypothetical protein
MPKIVQHTRGEIRRHILLWHDSSNDAGKHDITRDAKV